MVFAMYVHIKYHSNMTCLIVFLLFQADVIILRYIL